MNPLKRTNQLAIFLLATAVASRLLAQDAGAPNVGDKPHHDDMMAMMEELAKPGENHKLLTGGAGTWEYHGKFWVNPDPKAPPMEYSGKMVAKPLMGGRYVQSDIAGKMQMPGADGKMKDMDFKGMSIDGYDNVKKKFISTWVDNMGTSIMMLEGTYDPSTKTITYLGEEEPMPGMKTKMRQVVKLIDNNHHVMEFYEDRGGTDFKAMEITYVRK